MNCFVNFIILGIFLFFLTIGFLKTKKFLFSPNLLLNILFFIVLFSFVLISSYEIYNLIKYNSCQKPRIIFEGEAGPLAVGGKCPFAEEKDILCIFMDDVALRALNLPEAENETISQVYKKLPTILQWRIMINAFQRLSIEDRKVFEKFLRENDGYQIQILFYNKIPDYKLIIDQEIKKLREETIKTIYGEKNNQ